MPEVVLHGFVGPVLFLGGTHRYDEAVQTVFPGASLQRGEGLRGDALPAAIGGYLDVQRGQGRRSPSVEGVFDRPQDGSVPAVIRQFCPLVGRKGHGDTDCAGNRDALVEKDQEVLGPSNGKPGGPGQSADRIMLHELGANATQFKCGVQKVRTIRQAFDDHLHLGFLMSVKDHRMMRSGSCCVS